MVIGLKMRSAGDLTENGAPSPGMIYPLLNQLESEGYITGHWDEPTKRTIRIYHITDKGREHYNVIKQMKQIFL